MPFTKGKPIRVISGLEMADKKRIQMSGKTHKPGLVLIVDDEPRYLESVAEMVKGWGYKVLTALSGVKAAGVLVTNSVDVILLDLHMPVADGHKVIDYINKKALNTRVIAISGDPTVDDAIKALNRGVDALLRKPIAPKTLQRTLEKSLTKKLSRDGSLTAKPKKKKKANIHQFLFENAPNPMFFLDAKGVLRIANKHFYRMTGFEKQQIAGAHWGKWIDEEDWETMRYLFEDRRDSSDRYSEVTVRLRTNRETPDKPGPGANKKILSSIKLNRIYSSRQSAKKLFGYYGVAQDITQKNRHEELEKFSEFHDPLTGFPNNVLLQDYISCAIHQSVDDSDAFSLIYVELEGLKKINERYGHAVGDTCISKIAIELSNMIRKDDIVSRIDGSEFVLLLQGLSKETSLCQFARKVQKKLTDPMVVENHEIVVPVNIGSSVYPRDGETSDELIQHMRMTKGFLLSSEDSECEDKTQWVKMAT
jgi:diguanylate cyclase (GGDEF)-like protein